MKLEKISIIIPVLNEAGNIAQTIAIAQNSTHVEIIVVDGGSEDETLAIAQSLEVKVLASARGRAKQMNAGGQAATGNILLFLHGDTCLPAGFDELIRNALKNKSIIAGAFKLKIEGSLAGLRLIEWLANWRSRFLSLPYGDQAIFLRATTFAAIGGFANLPIMEDFEFIGRLKQRGKICLLPAPVITSGRRWQKLGVVKTTLINQLIILGYYLRIPPAKLAQLYRRKL